ncbi:phage tail tape measure protein [Rhodospirillum centenum]|uniref:Phage tail tape measure protein, TP901 family, core region n=1 Tax=Rhodospirillum centenum (strain ATCC 51521 / SW) TaxID=414684 RepID=B6IMG4_RHOCS|nr:phage tail tape measure protein [Rhodospirillum centenum]ACI98543.1 phage tail tape measure protein, TP901 family, core region [Rhodospirillum centenum SW]
MDNLFNMAVIISAIDRASGPIRRVGQSLGDLTERAQRMAEFGQQMTVAGALTQGAANQMTGALGKVINPAIQFESTMADVKRVVNFDTPEAFAQMGDDILAMSTRIPMAASGLGDIVAAAGQAGIARHELLQFAEDAAKMGVAFDMSGAEAGAAMTGLRTIFALTQDQVVSLGDGINHLANNMDATASGLLNIMNRAGSTAKLIGLTGEQTAALGAAFLALKTPPEVAATGMNALFNKLATADKQGKRFQEALSGIGMSAEQLKGALAEDAQGALLDFLGAVQQSDDVMGTLTDLFGAEYADDMAKLVGSLDTYRGAVGLVAQETAYAGSMQAEYQARSETTENALQLMNNVMNRLGVTLGNLVLPTLNEGLLVLQDLGNAMTDFAKANPTLFKVALGFFGILAVALAIVAPILSVVGGLVMMGSYGLMGVAKLGAGLKWLRGQFLRVLPAVRALAANIWRLAVQGAARFSVGIARMAASLVTGLVPALGSAVAGAWAFTAALLANPITWVVLALAAAAAVVYAYWEPIKAFFQGLWQGIEAAFKPVLASLEGAFAPVGAAFAAAFAPFAPLLDVVSAAFDRVVGWVRGFLEPLGFAQSELDGVRSAGASVGEVIGGVLATSLQVALLPLRLVIGAVTELFNALAAVGGWLMGQWQEVVAAFDQGLIQGLVTVFGKVNPVGWLASGFSGLTDYLLGIDLSSAGANIVNTIWEGMKSVASKPAEAIKEIVGQVREYLPFSPAKVGPLSDLDRIKLVETVADSVRPEPLVNAMRTTAAAGMAALTMAGAPAAATELPPAVQEVQRVAGQVAGLGPVAQASFAPVVAAPQVADVPAPAAAGGPVNISFAITVEGNATAETVEALEERLQRWVRENGPLLARAVGREQTRAGRMDFGEGG